MEPLLRLEGALVNRLANVGLHITSLGLKQTQQLYFCAETATSADRALGRQLRSQVAENAEAR